MLDLLTKSDNTATTAVSDVPAVKKAKEAFEKAQKAFAAIQQQVVELDRLCAPVLSSSSTLANPPSRLEVLHAQSSLPGVRLKLFESELALEAAKATLEQATKTASQLLTEARVEARRAMIVQLFTVLREAQQIAQDIEAYDQETTALGGRSPLAPVGELLSDQYRQSFVQGTEAVLKREGWL